MGRENVYLGVTAMQCAVRPRCVWLALEPSDVIELKQVVLDRDVSGAGALFRRVVVPRVRDAAQRRGIPLDVVEEGRDDGCLSG